VGLAHHNENGTFDLGPMQINTTWLPELYQRFGITGPQLLYDPCLNTAAGTWILKKYMIEAGDFWTGVAYYQSHNPKIGGEYMLKVAGVIYRNYALAFAVRASAVRAGPVRRTYGYGSQTGETPSPATEALRFRGAARRRTEGRPEKGLQEKFKGKTYGR